MKRLVDEALRLPRYMGRLPDELAMAWIFVGLFVGWWLYVPVHELLHVAGCVLAGGEVSRLEIDALYGGALLERIFPFVVSGSEYAGQLTGFDTQGSDWVYQSTVLMPYVITVFPGMWLWRRLLDPATTPGPWRSLAAGAVLPLVAAPLISLTGDYYESGSIVISALFADAAGRPLEAWRSDDVFRLIGEWPGTMTAADSAAIGAGIVLSVVFALVTLWLGALVAAWIDRRRASTD